MAERLYPRLSSIVSVGDLPEQLSFIQTGLNTLFDKIYFKDLQFTKSEKGDAAYYSLTLVIYKELGIEIPGTGIELLLNPDHNASGITEVPVELAWEWKILGVIRSFKTQAFSHQGKDFFSLITKSLLGLTGPELMAIVLDHFFDAHTPLGAVEAFRVEVNANYGTSIPAATSTDPAEAALEVLGMAVLDTGKDPFTLIYEVFLEDLDDELTKENIGQLFEAILGMPPIEYVKDLIIPKVKAGLKLGVGIAFPRNMLTPLDASGNPLPEPTRSMVTFGDADFSFSTETGIGYDIDVAASLNHPSMIGKTGLTLHFTQAKLDISRTRNIPEATLDGRPDEFVGVYIETLDIGLPPFIKPDAANPMPPTIKIVGRKLLLGTGGISGRIALETTGGGLKKTIGDRFQVTFNSFDIEFKQNAILSSNIAGKLLIPGFKDAANNDAEIDIKVHFGMGGDFSVTASETTGITLIKIKDVLTVDLKSVEIGRKDDRFYIAVSGSVDFTLDNLSGVVGQLLPDKIEVQKLLIWDNGDIEFEGGKIVLPKALSLKIGPVELSVSALGMGSHEQNGKKYKYVTFDGGINVNPGGVDVSGSGIAVYWTVDSTSPREMFIRIQSIKIDLIIPGSATPETATLLLKGWLSMKNPASGVGTEYAGGIEFTLPKLKMGGSAAMRLNPKVPAFLVDVGLELATPILLGSTGLGIYGFRGLVGQRYVATKEAAGLADTDPWWMYYKAKIADSFKEGITTDKFSQEDGFSLGAGVSLATAPDSGKIFSSKLFFLLSLPEVFLLQGQGAILKERVGLDTTQDPPFFALLSITSTSIEAAFGINYQIPDDGADPGAIATVNALIEMGFFWGNAAGWYINIGKDQPTDRRISVRLLKIVNAYFYMMLSSQGIRAGAGASYELNKRFGPLKAELSAYLDVAGKISFKPKQIGGSIAIGGAVGLSIFGFGFRISVAASLAAEAPKPFNITGSLKVCVRVLRKDRCAKFEFSWTFNNNLDLQEFLLFNPGPSDHAKALNMQTEEGYAIYASTTAPSLAALEDYIIPADSYIDIEFVKGVRPSAQVVAQFGGNTMGAKYIDYIAPQRAKNDRVRHEYMLNSIRVQYWNGSAWADYEPYVAATAQALLPFFDPSLNLATLPKGYWQIQSPDLYNKLRVMATSPITYSSQGSGDLILEELNVSSETIFCDPEPAVKECWDFTAYDPQLGYTLIGNPLLPNGQFFFKGKALMQITSADGEVAGMPYQNFPEAVRIPAEATFKAAFVEPMTYVSVLVKAVCVDLVVAVHRRRRVKVKGPGNLPVYEFVEVQSWTVPMGDPVLIEYDDMTNPVELLTITPSACKPPRQAGGGLARTEADPKRGCVSCGKDVTAKEPVKMVEEIKADAVDAGSNIRVAPVDSGELSCTLTREAILLQQYFNTLADNNLLADGQFNYFPDWRWLMDGVFQYTQLYPAPADEKVVITHERALIDQGNLQWRVYDDRGFVCDFSFELIQTRSIASLGWDSIRNFTNLRVDPDRAVNGPNFHFLVDVEINGLPVTLRGSSCYRIAECSGANPCVPTDYAAALERYLAVLGADRFLGVGHPVEYHPGYSYIFDGVFQNTVLYNKPIVRDTVITHTPSLLVPERVEWRVTDHEGFSCDFWLETANGERIDWSDAIILRNLRMDPSNTVPGSNYGFLIDATISGVDITLRGGSCYPIAECEESDPCRICEPYPDMLKAIENFLQRFVEVDNLSLSPVNIYPYDNGAYDGYFYNSLLYGAPIRENHITYVIQNYSDHWLGFDIMDQQGYRCRWNLYAPDRQPIDWKQVIKIYDLQADFSAGTYGPIYAFTATVQLNTGEVIQITGSSCNVVGLCRKDCAGYLYQICVMGYEGSAWNDFIGTLPPAADQIQTMINAFNGTIQPVWRFNTHFRIEVTTDDQLYRESSQSLLTNYLKTHYFAFRTAGPPGHFHQYQNASNVTTTRADYAALEAEDREDEYKQRLLLHYLDFPKCYPNADGQLLNSKPLFYKDPKLGVYFTKAYVYQFYNDWNGLGSLPAVNSKLLAVIKDPAPDPLAPLTPDVLATWEVNALPNISTDVTILNNMMDNTQPGDCTPSYTITPNAMYPSFSLPELLPLKLYTAIFNAHFKKASDPSPIVREVHRYGFQTSRYPDFEAQIQSWKLKVDDLGAVVKSAIFVEERPWTGGDIALAVQVLDPADLALPKGDPLRQTFGHKFNRLIEGVLKLESLHPAATTEFNVLRQEGTGRTLGILVKNPEPFNDPKTPIIPPIAPPVVPPITAPVRLSVNGGAWMAYEALYSKDFSQVFLYKDDLSLNIPAGASLAFEFDYVLFDGVAYTVAASELVNITLP